MGSKDSRLMPCSFVCAGAQYDHWPFEMPAPHRLLQHGTAADQRRVQQYAAVAGGLEFRHELLDAGKCARLESASRGKPAQRLAYRCICIDDVEDELLSIVAFRQHSHPFLIG
jgi:hypothetical protein